MTKLLEFNPQEYTESTTTPGQAIGEDIWFSCTPDLPLMRYAETIPVFIWDEMKTYKPMEATLGISSDDFKTEAYLAYTHDKFLPFGNRGHKDGSSKYEYILPSSPTWTTSVADTGISGTPKRVLGRILHVNLVALRALDVYYNNTIVHTRQKMKVYRHGSKPQETQAWVYTMPSSSFSRYLPHEKRYELIKGFDPAACSQNNNYGGGDGCYSSTYLGVT